MRGILERLDHDVVLGAEGYLFELERRGYVKSGPFVPEVVLDHPGGGARAAPRDAPRRGGGDGRVHLLRPPREAARDRPRGRSRAAEPARAAARARGRGRGRRAGGRQHLQHLGLRPGGARDARARSCARCTASRWAGRPRRAPSSSSPRRNDYLGEALIALEVIQEFGLPSVVTFASTSDRTIDGYELRRRVPAARGRGRRRRRAQLLARAGDDAAAARARPGRGRLPRRRAAGSLPHDARRSRPSRRCATPTGRAGSRSRSTRSSAAASRWRTSPPSARDLGVRLHRRLLRRRAAPRAGDGRAARADRPGEPVLARPVAPSGPRRERPGAGEEVRELEGLSRAARVVVVGGGVVGLACAWELRRARRRRRRARARARSAAGVSRGNTGWVSPELDVSAARPGDGARGAAPARDAAARRSCCGRASIRRFVRWLWSFRRNCSPARFDAGVRALLGAQPPHARAVRRLPRRRRRVRDAHHRARRRGAHAGRARPLPAHLPAAARARLRGRGRSTSSTARRSPRWSRRSTPERVVAGLHARVDRFVRPEELTAGLAERAAGRRRRDPRGLRAARAGAAQRRLARSTTGAGGR